MSKQDTKKQPNYKRRERTFKTLGFLSNIAPIGVIIGLTTELARSDTPGLAINFGIAGLTVVVVGALTALGKIKDIVGNRIFFLALATIIMYVIQQVAAEMVIGLMSSLGGASLGTLFKQFELSSAKKLEEVKEVDLEAKKMATFFQHFKNI